jgi:hypothetical protein
MLTERYVVCFRYRWSMFIAGFSTMPDVKGVHDLTLHRMAELFLNPASPLLQEHCYLGDHFVGDR